MVIRIGDYVVRLNNSALHLTNRRKWLVIIIYCYLFDEIILHCLTCQTSPGVTLHNAIQRRFRWIALSPASSIGSDPFLAVISRAVAIQSEQNNPWQRLSFHLFSPFTELAPSFHFQSRNRRLRWGRVGAWDVWTGHNRLNEWRWWWGTYGIGFDRLRVDKVRVKMGKEMVAIPHQITRTRTCMQYGHQLRLQSTWLHKLCSLWKSNNWLF